MAVHDYYERFYLQERVSKSSGFPPPDDWVDELADGMVIKGKFIQLQSNEVMIGSSQNIKTQGRFIFSPALPLRDGDIVRRECDGVFLRITGDPVQSPNQAISQVKALNAVIIERSEILQ
jgi:hypothetical protein